MADDAPEFLSAEELRNRLYHSLRNRGLVNSIKSQLRTNLITELQQSVQGPLTVRDLEPRESEPLLLRAANSLVADHLRQSQYEYSLGVFLPESGLAQDKVFQPEDLLRLLHISPQSRLYKRLWMKSETEGTKGLLWQILSEVAALHANATQDSGIQADLSRHGPITSLDDKLHSLEELYSSRRDELGRSSRSSLKLELARLKDSEIARMRMEEKENSRKELEQTKRELQRTYQEKYDALVERERNAIERLQKEQEVRTDSEGDVTTRKRGVLPTSDAAVGIESIRQREAELKREAEVNKREKQLCDDRNKAKEDELRRREMELRNKEVQFDQRLQNEMAQFKLDHQAKFIERVQNVEIRECKVKEEERFVAEEKSKVQSLKDELRDKTHRVNELETALQEARHAEVTATRHNEFINAKMRDMADYKTLKEQCVQQRNELETLRTRLSEVLNMNERERGRQEELLRELRRPTPETLMMQRDLERARENLRQEQVVSEQQKQLLDWIGTGIWFRGWRSRCLQMKEMNREVVDLRKQLAMTQTALNSEVYRKPKDGGQDGTALNVSHRSGTEPSQGSPRHSLRPITPDLDPRGSRGPLTYLGDKDVYNDVDSEVDLIPSSRQRRLSEFSDDHSSAASADIVAETKYRLQGLEKEAQTLERAYHDFHCQMTNVSALSANPPPAVQPGAGNTSQIEIPIKTGPSHRPVQSPPHSPIPHDRPMSSTPYKIRPATSFHDADSFAELSVGKSKDRRKAPPDFNLSNASDDIDGETGNKDLTAETRHVESRPITVGDLEARPGSPSMLFVAGSESGGSLNQQEEKAKVETQSVEPAVTRPPASLPPISLDSAWKQPAAASLDDAWK
ncbi:hypothetical protein BaRGS_00038850, partial [Batillaria attramentaria]